jgi:hypothetical protein
MQNRIIQARASIAYEPHDEENLGDSSEERRQLFAIITGMTVKNKGFANLTLLPDYLVLIGNKPHHRHKRLCHEYDGNEGM